MALPHRATHLARTAKQRHRTQAWIHDEPSYHCMSRQFLLCFHTRHITTQVWIHDEPITPHYDSSLLFSFSTDDYVLNRTGRARIGEVYKRHRIESREAPRSGWVEWKECLRDLNPPARQRARRWWAKKGAIWRLWANGAMLAAAGGGGASARVKPRSVPARAAARRRGEHAARPRRIRRAARVR